MQLESLNLSACNYLHFTQTMEILATFSVLNTLLLEWMKQGSHGHGDTSDDDSQLNDAALQYLPSFPALTSLSLANNFRTEECINSPWDTEDKCITIRSSSYLIHCPHLRKLRLQKCGIILHRDMFSEADYEDLCKTLSQFYQQLHTTQTRLTYLDLSNADGILGLDRALDALVRIGLHAPPSSASESTSSPTASGLQLSSLLLQRCDRLSVALLSRSLRSPSIQPHLRELNLNYNPHLQDSACVAIAACPHLTSLHAMGCSFGDEACRVLSRGACARSLEQLGLGAFRSCSVLLSSAGVVALSWLPNLQFLNLFGRRCEDSPELIQMAQAGTSNPARVVSTPSCHSSLSSPSPSSTSSSSPATACSFTFFPSLRYLKIGGFKGRQWPSILSASRQPHFTIRVGVR